MREKTKIQYINSFYTDGSTARKYELTQPRWEQEPELPAAQPKRKPRQVLRVDPLALVSIAVSLAMIVVMVLGAVRFVEIREQERELAAYVQSLTTENRELKTTYRNGYDLERIREEAMVLGMVPAEQAEHITLWVQPPVEASAEVSAWEEFVAFFSGLFA
jgi:cell division protein FtsL